MPLFYPYELYRPLIPWAPDSGRRIPDRSHVQPDRCHLLLRYRRTIERGNERCYVWFCPSLEALTRYRIAITNFVHWEVRRFPPLPPSSTENPLNQPGTLIEEGTVRARRPLEVLGALALSKYRAIQAYGEALRQEYETPAIRRRAGIR